MSSFIQGSITFKCDWCGKHVTNVTSVPHIKRDGELVAYKLACDSCVSKLPIIQNKLKKKDF
jgi:hypothetical protein